MHFSASDRAVRLTALSAFVLLASSGSAAGSASAAECGPWEPGELNRRVIDGVAEVGGSLLGGYNRRADDDYFLVGAGAGGRLNAYAGPIFMHASAWALLGHRVVTGLFAEDPRSMVYFTADGLVGVAWQRISEAPHKRTIRYSDVAPDGSYWRHFCMETQLLRRIWAVGAGAKWSLVDGRAPAFLPYWSAGPQLGFYYEVTGVRTRATLGTSLTTSLAWDGLGVELPWSLGVDWKFWASFGRFTFAGDFYVFGHAVGGSLAIGVFLGPLGNPHGSGRRPDDRSPATRGGDAVPREPIERDRDRGDDSGSSQPKLYFLATPR